MPVAAIRGLPTMLCGRGRRRVTSASSLKVSRKTTPGSIVRGFARMPEPSILQTLVGEEFSVSEPPTEEDSSLTYQSWAFQPLARGDLDEAQPLMISKRKPPPHRPLIRPERIRRIGRGFAFVRNRFLHNGFFASLTHAERSLYRAYESLHRTSNFCRGSNYSSIKSVASRKRI